MMRLKTVLALSCITLMFSACDSDVHYVKAAPVDSVEQGELQ
jgi:hypothetical protein